MKRTIKNQNMKLFINKSALCFICGILICACSSKSEETSVQESVEETVVMETPAVTPVEEISTKAVEAKEVAKPTTQVATAKKSLYPNEVLNQVKAWDKKLKFLKTRFEQTTEYDGVPISKSQGMLYYDQAKNLLRLDTLSADDHAEQTAITDKKQILILDGQGREITTLAWDEWQQGQPNQALFDFGNYTALLARHNANLTEPYLLELTPKEGEEYTLYLTLSKEDFFPTNIKIVSDLMVTEAKLTDTQKNQPLGFNTFRAGGLFK